MRARCDILTHSLMRQPSATFATVVDVLRYRGKSTVHKSRVLQAFSRGYRLK